MAKKLLILLLVCVVAGATTWAAVHLARKHGRLVQSTTQATASFSSYDPNAWYAAVERVKEARDPANIASPLIIPPELKHYDERYWFLATQVAEIEKYKVHTCQDFLDLAALLQRGEMVPLAAATETYVLLGIGQRADDSEFTRFEEKTEDGKEVKPIDSAQLSRDYQSLQTLAQNFAGRSYDLNNPSDRHVLRINMLSSLRPEALRIMEEVASAYQRQFNRPLHVSSLVRPEQYQHALRRVNRNAVTIDSPPHSTGLAFDIDYRYMSAGEQTFVMAELARIKNEGRIEVIRERNANYHVFAFLHGQRPSDDLVTASLEKARPPGYQPAHHAEKKPEKKAVKQKSKIRRKRRR